MKPVFQVVTTSNHSQMSGSQMMKNKEDVAAIMKAKQQAGMYYARKLQTLYQSLNVKSADEKKAQEALEKMKK